MGRWAQRTRRGGGPGFRPPATITITSVLVDDAGLGHVIVQFSDNVTASDFNPNAFTDVTEGNPAEDVQQNSPSSLQYHATQWEGNVAPGDVWIYADVVTNVITPQNGVMT
jgi:hypothetical protein